MMISDLFIWIYLPDATEPVVAGKLSIKQTAAKKVGTFNYGKSYLARPEAIPLDPCTLPLKPGEVMFTELGGVPGAILDACPDVWGIRVINRLCGVQPYPEGYLLINDPGRAGNLAFSGSPAVPPTELASGQYPLADLLDTAAAVENNREADPELLKALHPGTGGARPKCNITSEGQVWLAKFPSNDDDPAISIPRLEHAIMTLGRECGINTAMTRIEVVDGKDVCLVARFDRDIVGDRVLRRGFVSARTVFYADPAYHRMQTGSYARLARWLGRYGCPATQRVEIFQRMVFNCIVRNTDDHELNHGLLHVKGDAFELAPAYDIVPNLRQPRTIQRHALLISDTGLGTVDSLASNAGAFGITQSGALEIINELECKVLDQWRDTFYSAGFGDEEIRLIEPVITALPLAEN